MIEINDSNHFDSQIKSAGEKLVVVDFGATWCGPCRAVAPRFRHLAETYGTKGEALFMKVDVDDCMDLAMTLGITALPTFVFYKNQVSARRSLIFQIFNFKKFSNRKVLIVFKAAKSSW